MEKNIRGVEVERQEPNQTECKTQESTSSARAALKRLIEEHAAVKKHNEDAQESLRKWKLHKLKIDNSNWKLELRLKKLQDETDRLQKEASVKSQESEKSRKELEFMNARNRQEAADFRTNFENGVKKYSSLCMNGHVEYSSNNLMAEIEEHHKGSKLLRDKIDKAQQELDKLSNQYDMMANGMTEEAKLLSNIKVAKDIIQRDNTRLLQEIKAKEEKNKNAKAKLKEIKQEIADLKNKLKK